MWCFFLFLFFKVLFIFREGKGKRERNIHVQEIHRSVVSCAPPTGDLAHNPDVCPEWESGWATLWFTGVPSIH